MATAEASTRSNSKTVHLPSDLHKAAKKAAIDDDMTLEQWYATVIADHLRRRDAANQANPPAN